MKRAFPLGCFLTEDRPLRLALMRGVGSWSGSVRGVASRALPRRLVTARRLSRPRPSAAEGLGASRLPPAATSPLLPLRRATGVPRDGTPAAARVSTCARERVACWPWPAASRCGHEGRQPWQTRAGRSEQCGALADGGRLGIDRIAVFLRPWAPDGPGPSRHGFSRDASRGENN